MPVPDTLHDCSITASVPAVALQPTDGAEEHSIVLDVNACIPGDATLMGWGGNAAAGQLPFASGDNNSEGKDTAFSLLVSMCGTYLKTSVTALPESGKFQVCVCWLCWLLLQFNDSCKKYPQEQCLCCEATHTECCLG